MTVLDTSIESQLSPMITREAIEAARAASQLRGVLDGDELGRMFAWMRPNDLIWNYWVNNYLLGNDPPAFDLLYWNADTTRLPAHLHSDFLDLILHNPLPRAGVLTVAGTPIDLSQVACDSFIVGGTTDHITPWQACYATTQMLGGRKEFVLSSSGHIQSVINPPGNAKVEVLPEPAASVGTGGTGSPRHSRTTDPGGTTGAIGWLSGPAHRNRHPRRSATRSIRRKRRRPALTCSTPESCRMVTDTVQP